MHLWKIAKMALMKGLETQEVGCGPCSRCGTFVLPRLGWSVIRKGRDRTLADVNLVCKNVVLRDRTGELKI